MTTITAEAVREWFAAAAPRPAETTDLGPRLLLTAVMLALIAAVYALMWRSWKRRAARHGDLPPLAPPPDPAGTPRLTLTGRYHGSTVSGDWLDRIVTHGLGARSLARIALTDAGVEVRRKGAPGFLIPASAVRGARVDAGIAGKVLTGGGLLVIVWQHGERLIDSGFRADHPSRHQAWVAALTASGSAAGTGSVPRTDPSTAGSSTTNSTTSSTTRKAHHDTA